VVIAIDALTQREAAMMVFGARDSRGERANSPARSLRKARGGSSGGVWGSTARWERARSVCGRAGHRVCHLFFRKNQAIVLDQSEFGIAGHGTQSNCSVSNREISSPCLMSVPRKSNDTHTLSPRAALPPAPTMSSKRTFKIAMPEGLDTHDTSPPPLPSWLKGFLVTSKAPSDVRRAGLEVTNILGEFFFKLAYDDVNVPASMVKPGSTEVPYDTAEAILVPGSPGTVFVALRPDECTVDPAFLAAAIVEEADKVGAEGWTKTAHTQRIIPVEAVAPEMKYLTLAKKIVDTHFPAPRVTGDPVTFAVRYEEHSPAVHLCGTEVCKNIADLVTDPSYEVDLEHPMRTILVIVAGGSVMMSVVEGYDKLHRFHIHSKTYTA